MNIQNGSSQEVELNIAPIVDCFTVLITFMLVSASFLSIGVFDAGVGAAGQSAANQNPPKEVIQLEMQPQFGLDIKLSGQTNQTIHLASQKGNWDFDGLAKELMGAKSKWPEIDYVVLSAENEIEYAELIKVMEKVRAVVPGVVLGGF